MATHARGHHKAGKRVSDPRRAFQRGVRDNEAQKSPYSPPYSDPEMARQWEAGWRFAESKKQQPGGTMQQENRVHTDAGRAIVREFEEYAKSLITEKGIWPLPMMIIAGARIEKLRIKTPDRQAYYEFCKLCAHRDTETAIFGIDRHGSPEQLVALDSVLTCVLYERPNFGIALPKARESFRFGIIQYRHQPRSVRPIDWGNNFWIGQMREELNGHVLDRFVGHPTLVLPKTITN